MGEQLVDVLRFFDTPCSVAEQVIDVPKILLEDIPLRRLCREQQMAEQLVEVPTVISYSSLQRTMEQHVDIPVPGGGGRNAGLQGFLPGQSSTAQLAFQERISERIVEQIVDSRVVGGGLQDFRPGQSSSSVARSPTDWLNTEDEAFVSRGGVALFPRPIKVRRSPGTRVRECPSTSANPRRLLIACAVGWTTTRVRLGHCSRIRRLARGGSACARNAPKGTRRGSAKPGRCWWFTGSRAWHPLVPS